MVRYRRPLTGSLFSISPLGPKVGNSDVAAQDNDYNEVEMTGDKSLHEAILSTVEVIKTLLYCIHTKLVNVCMINKILLLSWSVLLI